MAIALSVTLAMTAGAQAAPSHGSKIVYLTFDDGPNAGNDPSLLRILRREQVPATFFLVGSSLAEDREAATRLWLGGHAVGNHTYSHADLTTLDAAAIEHQLAWTQKLLGPAGGQCMRPPYGAINSTVTAEARHLGLKPILWSVDPQDWAHQNTAYILDHVLTHVRDHSVVLLHDGGGNRMATVAAVRQLIPKLKARGFEFRTIGACRVPLGGQATGMSGKKPTLTPTPTPTVTPTPSPVDPTPTDSPTPSTTPLSMSLPSLGMIIGIGA